MSKPIILLIDDEKPYAKVIQDALELIGLEVLLAHNAMDALNLFQQVTPDLILLDVMMPGLSGYEVCQRLKTDPGLSHAYVIMLTAKGQAKDHERGMQVGADEYITKPFNPKHLVRRVAEVLNVQISSSLLG